MKVDELRVAVFKKTIGRCAYCGEKLELDGNWHIEHIIPKSRGGANSIENYYPSCQSCNNHKKDNTPNEFREYIYIKFLDQFYDALNNKKLSFYIRNYIDYELSLDSIIAIGKYVDDYFGIDKIKFFYERLEEARAELAERKNGKKDVD